MINKNTIGTVISGVNWLCTEFLVKKVSCVGKILKYYVTKGKRSLRNATNQCRLLILLPYRASYTNDNVVNTHVE